MFGRTGPHRPQNVGQERNIFWSVVALNDVLATFKSLFGAA